MLFVYQLDLGGLYFDGIVSAETGRPVYHPAGPVRHLTKGDQHQWDKPNGARTLGMGQF